MLAGDVVALLGAACIAMLLPVGEQSPWPNGSEVLVVAFSLPLFFVLAHLAGLYHLVDRHLSYTFAEEVGPAFMTVTTWAFLVLMGANVVAAEQLPNRWFAVLWGLAFAAVLLGRVVTRRMSQQSGWYRQRAVVIGDPGGIDRVIRRVRRHPECGLDLAGAIYRAGRGLRAFSFDSHGDRHDLGYRASDSPREAIALIGDARIERVVVTGWAEALEERTELIRALTSAGLYVDIVSGEPEALLSDATMHHLEGLPLLTVRPSRVTRTGLAMKRAVDVTAAALGLLVLAPLLAYISLRIKLDSPGPVFFKQVRAGRDGDPFEIFKFRTMVDDAEELREDLREETGDEVMFKLKEDPRVTRYGARIRRSSLDELPQLINVVRGDMSLVGPRPLPLDEARFMPEDHFSHRDRMRPGITGPWQIHGRSDIPFEDMIKLDYTYVSAWSLQEDLRLLIRTVGVVLAGRGAY